MTALSPGQIYNVARQAGFGRIAAVTATAVALAESGGRPDARCNDCFPGVHEDSRGLWQINVVAHPDLAGWNLYDPATNARAAFKVSSGGHSFTPWSTYTNGAYRNELTKVYSDLGIAGGAQPPDQANAAPLPADGSSSSSSSATGQPAAWWKPWTWGSSVGSDLQKVTLTGVFTLAGLGLVVVGLYKGVSPTVQRVRQEATDAAGQVASVAKAAAV